MPLNTEVLRSTLKVKIKQALDAPINEKSDSNEIKQDLADSLANAIVDGIDTWIKTATVTVQPGISVSTVGGPTAQTGVTTGIGTGTIS